MFQLQWKKTKSFVFVREAKATELKQKEALSVERVPGTLSTASKSVQVNGAATVRVDFLLRLFNRTQMNVNVRNKMSGASMLRCRGGFAF